MAKIFARSIFVVAGLQSALAYRHEVKSDLSLDSEGKCSGAFNEADKNHSLSPAELCEKCTGASSSDASKPCKFCFDNDGFRCSAGALFSCSGVSVKEHGQCASAGLSAMGRECPADGAPLGTAGALGNDARLVWGGKNFMQASANGLYDDAAQQLNSRSRDWGIVPSKFASSTRVGAEKGERLNTRLDRLGTAEALWPGDMFFVFKRDRFLYKVTASVTQSASHPMMPSKIDFGHAGVITHKMANCPKNEWTKCVYVTEQGLEGLEFRPIHEAFSGQSEVLVLRPRYEAGQRAKVVQAAEAFLEQGLTYNFSGAVKAIANDIETKHYDTVEKADKAEKLFCSYFAMTLMAKAGFLNFNSNLKLAPSMMADAIMGGNMAGADEKRILFPKDQLDKWGSLEPSEVVLYQQCAEKAESKQVLAEVTYPFNWQKKVTESGEQPYFPWKDSKWAPVPP